MPVIQADLEAAVQEVVKRRNETLGLFETVLERPDLTIDLQNCFAMAAMVTTDSTRNLAMYLYEACRVISIARRKHVKLTVQFMNQQVTSQLHGD